MVEREGRGGVGGCEAAESFGKPDVLPNDFGWGLDIRSVGLHRVGDTPASSTSYSRLLGNCKGNTLFERADDHGSLPISGATRYGELGDIDIMTLRDFERINDARYTPCPCHRGGCGVIAAVELVELALTTATYAILDCNLIVVEGDGSYTFRSINGETTDSNDGWRARARGNVGPRDGHSEGNSFVTFGCNDKEFPGGVYSVYEGGFWGKGSQLVTLEELVYFLAATGPVGFGFDFLATDKCEWVRKLGIGFQLNIRWELGTGS